MAWDDINDFELMFKISEEDLGYYTQYGPVQTDIPHMVDFALREGQKCGLYSRCNFVGIDGYVEGVNLCPPPHDKASGSHRVLFFGELRSKPFVVAVEELEGWSCGTVGEAVYIGIDDTSVLPEDKIEFLKQLVLASTGVDLYLPTNNRGADYREKIHFHLMAREAVFSEDCTLSDEASRCVVARIGSWTSSLIGSGVDVLIKSVKASEVQAKFGNCRPHGNGTLCGDVPVEFK